MFSVVDGVLLKPLAYENPDRILLMWERHPHIEMGAVSYPNFLDWRRRSRAFTSMAAYRRLPMNLTGDGDPVRVDTAAFSATAFDVLGTKPLIGRAFHMEEDREGAPQVTILSYGFWQSRYGGDPGVLGRSITLDGLLCTVIGVMPPAFQFPPANDTVQLFLPLETFGAIRYRNFVTERRNRMGLRVVARLASDLTLEDARAETDALARQLEEEHPEANASTGIGMEWLHTWVIRNSRQPLLLLLAAVGGLMLIACANVANLLLGRVSTREREMAVRTALGAGGGRLVRMLLTESMVLWLAGGLLGLGLAYAMTQVLVSELGATLPRLSQCAVDHRAAIVALGVSLFTGCIFGLIPALKAMRTEAQDALRTRGSSVAGGARHRMRSGLVIVEVGLALALLVGAGLTIRTFWNLIHTSPGLDPRGVLATEIALPDSLDSKYFPPKTEDGYDLTFLLGFYNGLLDEVRAMPGVESAATVWMLPFARGGWQPYFHVEGWPEEEPGQAAVAEGTTVSPGYFRTMGIPLIEGRDFNVHDTTDTPFVAIVDEKIAARYWPGESPLGKRLKLGDHASDRPWLEVIGVVGHVKFRGVQEEVRSQIYIPEMQHYNGLFRYNIVARTTGEPTALMEPIRRAVMAMDPELPISSFRTMEDYVGATTQQGRLVAGLLGLFAATALILAGVGLYGVMSGVTAERTHEIAVRMAIGARGGQVVRMILRQAMTSVAVGTAFGLTLSMILSRLAESQLFGITHLDPATYVGAFLFLTVVAILASAVPAFRATTVDPMSELRTE
jgi:putative ABC transport system permease protein